MWSSLLAKSRVVVWRLGIDVLWLCSLTTTIILLLSLFSDASAADLIKEFFRPIGIGLGSGKERAAELANIVVNAAPLWLSALCFSIPLKAGYFNIGGEGQIVIGSFAAVWTLDAVNGMWPGFRSNLLSTTLVFSGAMGAGMIWAIVPYAIKRLSRVSEVITSIVLNYMAAITIIVLLKWTGLASKSAQGICTRHVASGAYGSEWFGLESTSSLVCLFAAIAAGGYWWLWRTGAGLRLRASGINERASSLLGLKREKIELWAVALAGSCGGLVGLLNTLGTRRFSLDALTGLGFDGILVAIMGRHRASGVLLTSVFLAMWRNFAVEMQSRGLPYESYILAQALFLIVYLLKNRKPSYD